MKYKYKIVRKVNGRSCSVRSISPYSLRYKKDTHVYADSDTLGVMVFKTRAQAESFLNGYDHDGWMIKRVIPVGRGKSPERVSASVETRALRNFYKKGPRHNSRPPIDGTICYPGVYVVD